jgi:predicted ester cyclase
MPSMQPNRLLAVLALFVILSFVSCDNAAKQQESTTAPVKEENKKAEMAKSFYPLFEKGDWASIEKMISADFTDHNPWTPPAGVSGRDTAMKALKDFRTAFPNMKFEILHTAVDGDMVFVHYHFTASNDGPFMGMPATNKKLDFTGIDLLGIKDSIFTEHWDYGDNITFMKQMGQMP